METISDQELLKKLEHVQDLDLLEKIKRVQSLSPPAEYKDESIEAGRLGVENALTLGAAPTVKAALYGQGIGLANFMLNKGVKESFERGKSAFVSQRKGNIEEQKRLEEKHPIASLTGNAVGSFATIPLIAAPAIAGMTAKQTSKALLKDAAKIGATFGAGHAAGRAESAGEAAVDTLIGGATGGLVHYGLEGIGKVVKTGISKAKNYYEKIFSEPDLKLKIASTTSGATEQEITTYAQRTNEIDRLAKKYGTDVPSSVQDAKDELNAEIGKLTGKLNRDIKMVLDQTPEEKVIPVNGILDSIEHVKLDFNPITEASEVVYTEGVIDTLKLLCKKVSVLDKDGKTAHEMFYANLKDVNAMRTTLAKESSKVFKRAGGIFHPDVLTSRASAAGYKETRAVLKEVAPEELTHAFTVFHRLHQIENKLSRNFLNPDAPAGSYLAAGAGENKKNLHLLQAFDNITGGSAVQSAKDRAAHRTFANPSIIPSKEKTGYSIPRMLVGGAIGGAAGAAIGVPGIGGVVGGMSASPFAVKQGIRASNFLLKKAGKIKPIDPATRAWFIQNANNASQSDSLKRRLMTR